LKYETHFFPPQLSPPSHSKGFFPLFYHTIPFMRGRDAAKGPRKGVVKTSFFQSKANVSGIGLAMMQVPLQNTRPLRKVKAMRK